jgi:hypothetical protein
MSVSLPSWSKRAPPGQIGSKMQENEADREARLRELASKLFFILENQGLRFGLYRYADLPKPIRRDGLTLDEETCLILGNFAVRMVA